MIINSYKVNGFNVRINVSNVFTNYYRVRLSKRRGKSAKSAMNSKLVVKHRELVEDEVMAQVKFLQKYCGSRFINGSLPIRQKLNPRVAAFTHYYFPCVFRSLDWPSWRQQYQRKTGRKLRRRRRQKEVTMMAVKVLKRRQKTRMTLSKLLGVGRTMISLYDNYL